MNEQNEGTNKIESVDSSTRPVSNGVDELKPEIQYDDFAKLDIRIGHIVAAEKIEGADKLIKCTIDFGAMGQRTIVSGIAEWKTPEELIGKRLPYIVNLAPRVLRGVESAGMLLAASDESGVALIEPERLIPPGTKLK
jgi:methionyl-tRNA synthetase